MKQFLQSTFRIPPQSLQQTNCGSNSHDSTHSHVCSTSSKAKILLVVVLLALNFTYSFSQPPNKEWDARFGGTQGDFLYALQQTSDGGYILGGYSESDISGDVTQTNRGSSDYWIVKTDSTGVKQWDARFGGISVDQLTSLQETSDGGYILGGRSFSKANGDKSQTTQGKDDFWIVKTNANGVKEWDATFGGKGYDELNALEQTSDGGYVLGGFSKSGITGDQTNETRGGEDYWIVKTDANGVKQWDARFGGKQFDVLNALEQTSDGGYLLGGYSLSDSTGDKSQNSQGLRDYWIVKTNANGVKQWDAAYGGSSDDVLTDLEQTMDGGYILGGWSWSQASGDKTENTKGDNDYWIVKIDATGHKEWDKDFGGNSNDYLNPVKQTLDGGYILGGYSSSGISGDKTQEVKGGGDYWMVKTDGAGVKQWDADFGGTDFDFLSSLDITTDDGYILGGYSSSGEGGDKSQPSQGLNDYWIVKTDAGTMVCNIPINLQTFEMTPTQAALRWDDANGAMAYKIGYKTNSSEEIFVTTMQSHVLLQGLLPNTKYSWSVKSVCSQSPAILSDWSQPQTFTTPPLRLESSQEKIFEVYPNPFSNSATISFSLEKASRVTIELLNVDGKSTVVICDEIFPEGSHDVTFDRNQLANGIYFLRLKSDEGISIRKIVVE